MLDVFSDSKMKPSEQIRRLQKCAGSEFDRILLAGPEDEPLYMLKPRVIRVLTWINKNILYELPKVNKSLANTQWIGVRIRIATNMLNKCEAYIPKDICIKYHERLTSRTREILGMIYTEDLPF